MANIKIFLLVLFLISANISFAEDIYYAQTSAGGGTGIDCNNAKALSAITWGTGTGNIGPGDTAHLCGTLTSTLTVGTSGSSGSPITIKFEDNAKFSKNTWGASGRGIAINSRSYITVDGGTNGIIEATDNGTAKTYKDSFSGVGITNSSNIIIKNLTIKNLFIHTQGSAGGGCVNISIDDSCAGTSSNIYIYNNTLTWAAYGIYHCSSGTGSGMYVYNNNIQYINSNVFATASGSYTGYYFYNNNFSDPYPWDDSVNNAWHHEAFHSYGNGQSDIRVYNNYLYGDWGNNHTAGIYLDEPGNVNSLIYNNVMVAPWVRKIFIRIPGNHLISNNTLVGSGYSIDCSYGTFTVKNNIEYGTDGRTCTPSVQNNNLIDTNPLFVNPTNASGSSYRLQSGSPAINTGSSSGLTSYYTTDKDGNTRSGIWDIGAYEYISGDSSPPTVTITSPTSSDTYTASSTPLSMGGTASDNVGVTSVSYINSLGGSGSCSGTTSWTCSVPLLNGSNLVTIRASDAVSNIGTDTLTVTYIQPYTVSTSFNSSQGSISPTSRTVSSGSTTTFTVTANTGYQISSVTGCSGSLSGATYTTGAITADCTVTATFAVLDITPPVISGAYPSTEQKCTVRRTPITIGITTNENATCRYSTLSNVSYDSMSMTFSGSGTTSHSVSITPTCGITHTYYVHCRDTIGNTTSTPGTITFTVTPQYWRRGHNVDIR